MKQIRPITFILIFLITAGISQEVRAKDALEKGFTMKLSYVMPAANFGKMPNTMLTNNLTDDNGLFDPKYGFRTYKVNPGIGFQIGTMFYINAIDIGDQMKVGLDVTWLSINYNTTTHYYQDFAYIGNNLQPFGIAEKNFYHFNLFMEFGPMFSFSPMEKMAVDASFKLSPTFALMGGKIDYTSGDGAVVGGIGTGFRYTPAFYFRYRVFLVGFEYNIGSLNMTYDATDYHNWKGSTPYSTARLVFGFKF